MQSDVQSAHLSAAGSLFAGRARLKGFSITPAAATAATFEFRDTSATGAILVQIDIASQTNPVPYYIQVPGEGIVATDGIYVGVPANIAATVFYG